MKKTISIFFATILFFMLISAGKVNAQFFKNILNSVKNTAQSRANKAASDVTNKALDKVDPTTKSNNNGATTPNSTGKSDQDRVFGGFAKAAQDNPNDTSMADLLSKGLGNIMGGNGVSAADSAKALAAFKSTGNSGNIRCVYFEITNSITNDKGESSSSTTKQWFTSDGRARGEMNLAGMIAGAAGYQVNAKPVVIISRANMPNYSVTLNDEDKTYSLNVIDQALIDKDGESYKAYVIGTENVNGYPCKHAVVKGNKLVMDMWMSTAVPGYDVYKKAATASSGATGNFMSALKAAGAEGFPVKIFMENSATSMTLTKATYVGVSNDFFDIPSNYSEADNNGIITNLMQAGQSGQPQK
ncbi:MAG: DUF4412 domain-containing protein [Bacteroidetes bacterium]|nr:DUF4412 domain-containing protein [Bacteroidota bacterium]